MKGEAILPSSDLIRGRRRCGGVNNVGGPPANRKHIQWTAHRRGRGIDTALV